MTPEQMLAHCLARPGAWPDNPWGHELPVVKVHDKMAYIGRSGWNDLRFGGAIDDEDSDRSCGWT